MQKNVCQLVKIKIRRRRNEEDSKRKMRRRDGKSHQPCSHAGRYACPGKTLVHDFSIDGADVDVVVLSKNKRDAVWVRFFFLGRGSMEEEELLVVGKDASPWEATPLNEIEGANEKEGLGGVIAAQMFGFNSRVILYGGFPCGSKDYLPEIRSFLVDLSGRAVGGWSVVQTRRAWNPANSVYENMKSPTARIGYAGLIHRDKLFIHGGQSETFHDDFQCFNFSLEMWSQVPVSGVRPKVFAHALAAHRDNLFVFGGVKASTGKCSNELFVIPEQGGSWKALKPGPPRNDFGSLLSIAGTDRLIFFGGASDSAYHNDVWVYSISANDWQELLCSGDRPTPRSRHTSNLWKNNFLVVYGGSQAGNDSFDPSVYLLDIGLRLWHKVG